MSSRKCCLVLRLQELLAEIRASPAYSTSVLAEGLEAGRHLAEFAQQADDHVDVCCQVPAEVFEQDQKTPDTSMFGAVSLLSFSELVRDVEIDTVVKVVYKLKEQDAAHVVVIGPGGFQLCTCMQLLRCGIPCRHMLAALVTQLKRGKDFIGESIHPRWRTSPAEWSVSGAGVKNFDGHERGVYMGGFTDDSQGVELGDYQEEITQNSAISVARGRLLANMVECATRNARKLSDNFNAGRGDYEKHFELLQRFERDVDAFLVKDTSSGGSYGIPGILNPLKPITKSRKETRTKDCTEQGRSKRRETAKARADAAESEIIVDVG